MFLEIWHSSQESTCVRASFEFCEISKNTFRTEHLWTTASVSTNLIFNSFFSESNVKEIVLLASVQHREIITGIKKYIDNTYFLSFMKTCLHRPIIISKISCTLEDSKIFDINSSIWAFLTMHHLHEKFWTKLHFT